jgi:hypothetical protein
MLEERLSNTICYCHKADKTFFARPFLNELVDQILCSLNNVLFGLAPGGEFFRRAMDFKNSKSLAVIISDLSLSYPILVAWRLAGVKLDQVS